MLSRLLYRREAEKLLLMRAIKRGREEEEGGVIIALICGAMWSLLVPAGLLNGACLRACRASCDAGHERAADGPEQRGSCAGALWDCDRLVSPTRRCCSLVAAAEKPINGFLSSFNFYRTREAPLSSLFCASSSRLWARKSMWGRRRGRLEEMRASEDVQKVVFPSVSRTNGYLKTSNFQ